MLSNSLPVPEIDEGVRVSAVCAWMAAIKLQRLTLFMLTDCCEKINRFHSRHTIVSADAAALLCAKRLRAIRIRISICALARS